MMNTATPVLATIPGETIAALLLFALVALRPLTLWLHDRDD